ncbi:MAG: glutamate--tRNA ligase, partial [Candidatus Omnitrophica bacterium]|nr:glutamate--tRNA ligase [Candidatus Omnitrophota bacterium]
MVRVRFAPSPTGFLHIGGARTALFNWMYARAQNGQFILRIEDTDQVRSKEEYLHEIMESMTWLGLNWDEFYKQSERFDIYRKYAKQLLDEGKAYKDGEAVILKVPEKIIKMYDLIRDEISVATSEIKDQVLMKSDGSPTYSFACVVDDALMEISCVIRGEDHISNTPKQILIYEALGFKVPKFAHLPLILDPEGGRMSKRAGATAVTEYRELGFLPEGVVNYLMLLGWSPGNNQEVVPLANALKNFSIKK